MSLRILLATDGSDDASHAAWMVSQMAEGSERMQIAVMTVIQLPEVGGMVAVESWLPELLQREQEQAHEVFLATKGLLKESGAEVTSVVREGLVGPEIVAQAHAMDADLVVIGAKGHSTADRILLGSISDYVATHAKCSVLVVRPTGLEPGAQRPMRVTVGFDDSDSSLRAIEQFQKFHLKQEMQLEVVAVCQIIRTFRQDLLPNIVEGRAKLREAAAHAAAEGAQALLHVTPHVHSHVIEAEHIGSAIVDFADQHRSDFLVVGDTERGMLGRWFLGSVSRFVLRHATCSIWIARHE